MNIELKPIRYNFNPGRNKPEYIVLHDTGNPSPTADAENHYKYFNGGNRGASAHYFVDNSKVIQTVKDSDSAWHCGDGKGKYGITNNNSIGIEICLTGNRDRSISKAVELTAYLMAKYNIPSERVVRHYDASRKNCPSILSANNWAKWRAIKSVLAKGKPTAPSTTDQTADTMYYVQIGAYKERGNAENMIAHLKRAGINSCLKVEGKYYVVQAGAYRNKANAKLQSDKIKRAGFNVFLKYKR